MKKLKIAGIVLILFVLYVIIGMLVPFVHMQSVSKTNKSKIHTETFLFNIKRKWIRPSKDRQ